VALSLLPIVSGLRAAGDQLDEQEGNGDDEGDEGNENGQRPLSVSNDRHQRNDSARQATDKADRCSSRQGGCCEHEREEGGGEPYGPGAVAPACGILIRAGARRGEPAPAVALVAGIVVFAPVAALAWDAEREVWPYLVATSLLQLTYFVLLAAAYGRAELSFVYPIARGSAPVLVLLAGVALLDEAASTTQVGGVLRPVPATDNATVDGTARTPASADVLPLQP